MGYSVFFANLEEENRGLFLAILKLKEESDALEPGEAEVLYALRGSSTPAVIPPEDQSQSQPQPQPQRQRQTGSGGSRRGSGRRGPRPHQNFNN